MLRQQGAGRLARFAALARRRAGVVLLSAWVSACAGSPSRSWQDAHELAPDDSGEVAGVSEVICVGDTSIANGVWTLGSFTSLGRCKGDGTNTLKGCLR